MNNGYIKTRYRGKCCTDFTLPLSPMELKYLATLGRMGKPHRYGDEIIQIAEMVELIRNDHHGYEIRGQKKKFFAIKKYLWRYRCKNHDTVTGLCSIYNNRPDMCKNFPHYQNKACHYPDCDCPSQKVWREQLEDACESPAIYQKNRRQSREARCAVSCQVKPI